MPSPQREHFIWTMSEFGLRTHVLSITVRHRLAHPSLEFAITFAVTRAANHSNHDHRMIMKGGVLMLMVMMLMMVG